MAEAQLNQLMNEEELQQWILRQLGAPQLKVELTQCNLDDSVEEARRWFSAKKGVKRAAELPVSEGQTEFVLPDDVDTVIDMSPPSTPTDFSRVIDPLGLLDASIPYNLFPFPAAGGLFSTYAQALQYIELSKRITGGEVEWRQDGRKLTVFPKATTSGFIVIDYKANVVTIEHLNERDHDMVKRYALAWAKTLLGRVRSKYPEGYPAAQGRAMLDGMNILQEGEKEKEALDEELRLSAFPMGILTG